MELKPSSKEGPIFAKNKLLKTPPGTVDDSQRICFDRIIPDSYQPARSISERTVLESIDVAGLINQTEDAARLRAAIMLIKKWPETHRVLKCRFLNGDTKQKKKVEAKAHIWEMHANVKFEFVASGDADIRISFTLNAGSWSALGTDALVEKYFPKYQPTMNYGWLTSDTEDREYERVVLHEFGHVLGLIHEHQSPKAKLKWKKSEVYRVYAGYPNYWDKELVDRNILRWYSSARSTDATRFDPDSIMLYMFPNSLFVDGKGTRTNYALSRSDKDFIIKHYPFS